MERNEKMRRSKQKKKKKTKGNHRTGSFRDRFAANEPKSKSQERKSKKGLLLSGIQQRAAAFVTAYRCCALFLQKILNFEICPAPHILEGSLFALALRSAIFNPLIVRTFW